MNSEPYPTATACSSVRDTQMRHSASPRNKSTTRKLNRPTWSSERRLERATSRSGSSVSSARFAMCSILGSHGPFVHPSPPVPLSTSWRGGTQGQFFVPPLRIAERGTGGEDRESGTGGEVSSQVARLVGPGRARPSVASHARSLSRPRLRVHAAADTSESGGGVLSAVYRAVSGPRDAREREAPGCERAVGRAGVLRTRLQSPRARARGQSGPRWHAARQTQRADQASGYRAVHRGRRGFVRLREAGAGCRYQRQPCAPPRVLRSCNAQRATRNESLGAGANPRAQERQTRLALQSGHHGAGSADLRGAKAKMPPMSGTAPLQDG